MDVGIPAERHSNEYRAGLTPPGIQQLTQEGNRCYVEKGAGEGAGFSDVDYERAGARIVYDADEVWGRADMVLKVGSPTLGELAMARPDQIIAAFWHLAARPREVLATLAEKQISAVAYEMIQTDNRRLPVLYPLSEIAGRMAPQIAARWLQNDGGGHGVLISGIAGTPPLDVVILGAGVVGLNAARAFYGLGARVFVLDQNLERLQYIDERFDGHVTTIVSYDHSVAKVMGFADVVVGAVLVPGERTPIVVTREMVRSMRPRSVIIDFAVDQGGCIETTRPTTHDNPTFVDEGVIHYCVPNVTGVVARTSTHAYQNAAWPYCQQISAAGIDAAVEQNTALKRGTAVLHGQVMNPSLARLVTESV